MVTWIKEVETPLQTVRMGSDGIMRVVYKPGTFLDLQDAKAGIALGKEVGPGHPVPVVVDLRGITGMSRDARFYLSGPEGAKNHSALALITPNPVARIIGNIFIRFSSQHAPTRLCADEGEALAFLSRYAR
jgi:hypothetical protein